VAVEFAIIFPVFLFMLLFMLDVGRYLTVQMVLNNASQVGARYVAISGDITTASTQVRATVPDSIVRLSTLDPQSTSAGVGVTEAICPLYSENYTTVDLNGNSVTVPDGNCTALSSASSVSCSTVVANNRAMSAVTVSFKWITPLGLIISLADPATIGPGNSIYFDRNATDTTLIEGKSKLLCQN